MEYVTTRDLEMPVIGLGTWQLRGDQCREAVAHALEIGYRHLDTARMYGNEVEVGQGIRDSGRDRDEILVTTKVRGRDGDTAGVRREVEASLRDLQLDHIDLLLLHQPGPVPIQETMAAFREQQEAGRVRHLGVSNFSVAQLEEAQAEAPIVTVQNEHHPSRRDDDVLEWCQANGLAFTAYSPLGKGGEVDGGVLGEIGAEHDKTAAQVVLRWLIQQDMVVTIPRSSSQPHREQNLDIFDFHLTDDEMDRITRSEP